MIIIERGWRPRVENSPNNLKSSSMIAGWGWLAIILQSVVSNCPSMYIQVSTCL